MSLHPGALLGLPAGVPNATWDVAWWRDLVVLVGLASAWCEARGRRSAALGLAVAFGALAVGFWVAALGRPYGALVDPATTRWAADVAVAGWADGPDGFVAGEPSRAGAWGVLARRIGPARALVLPSVLPVFVVPAGALVLGLVWGRREASLGGILWVAGATGALDIVRGVAFVPGLWARPGPSLLWIASLGMVLAAGRARVRGLAPVAAAAVALGWLALGRRWPALGIADALFALTLDQTVWLVAGVAGLRRSRDPAALALVAAGALLTLSRALGGPGDPWAGCAFLRVGLVMGAAGWLDGITMDGSQDPSGRWARGGILPARLPSAIAIAVLLAGGGLAWWDPPHLDPVAKASLEPFPEALVETMDWVRAHTPPEASILAHEDYAPAVAVLGGRRVLRGPGLVRAADEERRLRLERAVFAGHPPLPLLARYGLRYVLLAPGEFREYGLEQPEDLERSGGVRLAYANPKGIRLYELAAPAGGAEAFK